MSKKLKPSELMLKGFAMAGENQNIGWFWDGSPRAPNAVCAYGAIRLADSGDANMPSPHCVTAQLSFQKATGFGIAEANDNGMSIPDIAGILAAEGL